MVDSIDFSKLPVHGSADVPDIFVDGYQGAFGNNGNVRLRLVRYVVGDTGEPMAQAVGYLVMGASTLAGFHTAIGSLIDQLAADGLYVPDPIEPPKNG